MNYSFVGERVFHSGMSKLLPAQEGASCPKICAPSELPSCGELTRIHGAHAPTAHLKNQLDPVLSGVATVIEAMGSAKMAAAAIDAMLKGE